MTTTTGRPSAPWAVSPGGRPGPALAACLRAAIAAPSLHNTQPWRFRLGGDPCGAAIDVLADPHRHLPVVDPVRRELTISIGAAVLNLRVAMLARGRTPVLRLLPDPAEPNLLARVTPGGHAAESDTVRLLDRAIPRRRTNRRPFLDLPVPPEVLTDLAAAAEVEGSRLAFLDPALRDGTLSLVRTAEHRRRNDPRYWAELARWTREDPDRRDGVPRAAFGPWPVLESLPLRDFGLVQPARRRRVARFEHEPVVAVLYTPGDGPMEWLRAGESLERVLLTATVQGVASTLMTQPMELPDLRELLTDTARGHAPQAIIRFGYGPPSPPTPRRWLGEVLVPAGRQ
ncbi:Acg family FMN-binding oxidoreductase [Rhizomonospora bruguierae]|uniref:Acg family FMN-binding oxidoreductase n=1 Tax=Rhizomonospora bruguierae TaxID=1581705 RepID=UPI001BCDA73F|nr:nitroreductase family protein [Micromonospora sp. NBRC 107566]